MSKKLESASKEFPQEEQGWQQGGLVSRLFFILIEASSVDECGPCREPGCAFAIMEEVII
jgi:hypothetical protein